MKSKQYIGGYGFQLQNNAEEINLKTTQTYKHKIQGPLILSDMRALMHGLDAANDALRPDMFSNLIIVRPPEWSSGNISSLLPIAR